MSTSFSETATSSAPRPWTSEIRSRGRRSQRCWWIVLSWRSARTSLFSSSRQARSGNGWRRTRRRPGPPMRCSTAAAARSGPRRWRGRRAAARPQKAVGRASPSSSRSRRTRQSATHRRAPLAASTEATTARAMSSWIRRAVIASSPHSDAWHHRTVAGASSTRSSSTMRPSPRPCTTIRWWLCRCTPRLSPPPACLQPSWPSRALASMCWRRARRRAKRENRRL
mmetsp:Transcript_58954/g.126715  ORF Transcript_58954/g.126715 Transcript_58954/m.126715 type:complete len:225 (-) Transcript_58954:258-932(-)